MEIIVLKHTLPYFLLLVLAGFVQAAAAESFMDTWLSRQKAVTQEWLAKQVASQVVSSTFNGDDWLARQKAKKTEAVEGDAAASETFDQDGWLSRQEETAGASESVNDAKGFRQETWAPAASWEADDDLERNLLSDIEDVLGKEHRRAVESRVAAIDKAMRPMFQALPKNEYGKLGHSSARYMLHRFFVAQHGWFIDGLFAEGGALNASSPSHMLKERVPMFVQGLFEKRLGGRGFGVHEMAVLVAVVEDSVHQEAQAELKKTYHALNIPVDTQLGDSQATMLVEAYMSGFVLNSNMSEITADELQLQRSKMIQFYPTWPTAQNFFEDVRKRHTASLQAISFSEISAIVRELVDTFGTFHGKQCQGLKQTLQGIESKGSSGCVQLPEFYNKGLKADTNWLFVESPDYLRQIGVLDESDTQNPRVLSANYINSPTNCVSPTGYYMVCCHNECDDILAKLENHIGNPAAAPVDIMAALRAMSSLSSPSLRAGRLAPALWRRLLEIAEHHDGRVPIHGRLFAQWLHHVYPHECPYPHVSGSKKPQWIEDFEEETGGVSQLTDAEMLSYVRKASKRAPAQANTTLSADVGSCAPWQNEEELFAPLPRAALSLHELENDPHVWNFAGGLAFIAAVTTFGISILRACKSMAKLRYQPKMLQI